MTSNLTRRIAARPHRCDSAISRHCAPINTGDAYLDVTTFTLGRRPERSKQCVYCAAVDGRDYLLGPIPATQDYRYWDIDSEKLTRDRADSWSIFEGI